jgi:hypothetical protein
VLKYLVEIKVSDKSIGAPYGSVIDLFLPSGFTVYNNCYNEMNSGSEIVISHQDYLDCIVGVSALAPFTGRK